MLLEGYNPPAAPDDRFYSAMENLRKTSDRLEAAARSVDDPAMQEKIINEAGSILRFQNELEKKYLLPKESDFRWQ